MTGSLTVDLSTTGSQNVGAGQGNDTLSNIQNLIGGSGNDRLTGDTGDNVLKGGAGDDTLEGGAGNDTLYGNDGNDKLYGGAGDDILYGGGGNNTFFGGAGNDTFHGSGNGTDTVDYGGSGPGRTIEFTSATQATAKASLGTETDTLNDIDNINGSNSDDTFKLGKAFKNLTIDGAGGNDTVDYSDAAAAGISVSRRKLANGDQEITLTRNKADGGGTESVTHTLKNIEDGLTSNGLTNSGPTAEGATSFTGQNAHSNYTGRGYDFNGELKATDAEGDNITFNFGAGITSKTTALGGTLEFIGGTAGQPGKFKYTPPAGNSGDYAGRQDSVSYQMTDEHGATTTGTFNINLQV